MSLLMLKDKIRASTVCKKWREAAKSVRVFHKHQWFVSIPTFGNSINLFDPLERKKYTLNLPEKGVTDVAYSKDGWLLMRRSSFVEFFFFNPYSRELISLPDNELPYQAIAFSSAPTSETCTLVTLNRISECIVAISTCYPGATEWITKKFHFYLAFGPNVHSNLVCVNDRFYCFTSGGVLFEFDPASRTLSHQAWDDVRFPEIHNNEWSYLPKELYLMEQKGELILMYTYGAEKPVMYKLVSSKWEEMSSTLDGLTIFASMYSSETRMDVLGMKNSVYFPKYGLRNNMQCVSYSYNDARYYPGQPERRLLCPVDSLWIDPPPFLM
ncbi:PREDICTED: F-box protein At4g00893-like [Brassica oleracea var. oleracea]|uniref:F-box domain-containing protein n=1 Tax=Brassica oleracea var. oleracea TaxID=109376 RepID=A0A0D3B894_BRAOL|nr:PREDICTED: F-box protein At4g00893-like [Brassica oleracea var. oleracea]